MMQKTTTAANARRIAGIGLIAGALALAAGCQTYDAALGSGTGVTASDPARLTRSGFLSDYARLKPNPQAGGIECWRDPRLDAARFDKVLVSRIVVSLAPAKGEGEPKTVDPSDLKTLTDYFHASLVKALKPQMQVVDKAGPGVVVIRIALTNLVPTTVSDSVAGTLIPYAFVAEAGSGVATGRPAGVVTMSISGYTRDKGFCSTIFAKMEVPADTLPVRWVMLFVATMPVPASPSGGQSGIPAASRPVGSSSFAPSAVKVPASSPAASTCGSRPRSCQS